MLGTDREAMTKVLPLHVVTPYGSLAITERSMSRAFVSADALHL